MFPYFPRKIVKYANLAIYFACFCHIFCHPMRVKCPTHAAASQPWQRQHVRVRHGDRGFQPSQGGVLPKQLTLPGLGSRGWHPGTIQWLNMGMGLYGWWMWMKIYLSIYMCVGLYHVISGCIVRSYSWLYDIWLYLVNLATSASRRFSIGLKASSWHIQNHPNGPATKAIAHANS